MMKLSTASVSILVLLTLTSPISAASVQISGKLIDRQCSVEDAYQLQPSTEKRCTLWVEESFSCPCAGCDGGVTTCKNVLTVCCPNNALDGRAFNGAYTVCADPYGMQIKHATKTYIVTAWARTTAQQSDGCGQFQGYQFQY